jgi:hypothetical protein
MPVAYAEALGQSLAALPHAQDHHPVSPRPLNIPSFKATPNKLLAEQQDALWLFPIQKRQGPTAAQIPREGLRSYYDLISYPRDPVS